MRLIHHADAQAFRQQTDDFLLRDEAMHNTIIGITSRLMSGETYDDVYLAHVEDDAGEVIAAVMRTAPHNPVLSNMDDRAALSLIVDDLHDRYGTLPGVLGRPREVTAFSQQWQARTQQAFSVFMEQGIYICESVTPPTAVSGAARLATDDDEALLVTWMQKFAHDTGMDTDYTLDQARENIAQRLAAPIMGGIRLWIDDGQLVSMAAVTRELPNGGVVSGVYTPPDYRGCGYGSAVTAATTQGILDAGKRFAALYTDLSNPTSNSIYQKIGYERVGTHRMMTLESTEETEDTAV